MCISHSGSQIRQGLATHIGKGLRLDLATCMFAAVQALQQCNKDLDYQKLRAIYDYSVDIEAAWHCIDRWAPGEIEARY